MTAITHAPTILSGNSVKKVYQTTDFKNNKTSYPDRFEKRTVRFAQEDTVIAITNAPTILSGNSAKKIYQTTTDFKNNKKSYLKKRTVRFAQEDTCSAYPPPLNEDECKLIWYAKEELKRIKAENKMIIKGLVKECSVGLEGPNQYYRKSVVKSVLKEQDNQRFDGIDDKGQIAAASSKFSTTPKIDAYSKGTKLEREVRLHRLIKLKQNISFMSRTKRIIEKRMSRRLRIAN